MGDHQDIFLIYGFYFEVFREASRPVHPSKSSFNTPSFGEYRPLFRSDLHRYIHSFSVFNLDEFFKSSTIPCVSTASAQRWILHFCRLINMTAAHSVVNICGVHTNSKQIPHDIGYYMAFATFRFFPPSIPRSSFLFDVFTLWESIKP